MKTMCARAGKPGRSLPVLAATLLLLLAGSAGCDWLKGSGSGSRVSPFLSGLRFSRPSVLCQQEVQVIFDYDDPQDDISLLTVTFQNRTSGSIREKQALWESAGDLDLTSGGRASLTYAFDCSSPGGRWVVAVQVEDIKGHLSNTITGEINLTSAGQ